MRATAVRRDHRNVPVIGRPAHLPSAPRVGPGRTAASAHAAASGTRAEARTPRRGPDAGAASDAAPPRASRTLTLLTAGAALSLGWMILNDHVAPGPRSAPAEAHVQAPPGPLAAPAPAATVSSRRRTPLLTGEAARRALAEEARAEIRRRFVQPSFPPGEEPAL